MLEPPVLVDSDGEVVTLTLNRPDKLNAFDSGLVEALISALDQAASDSARLVILQANGRGFSAGFDVSGVDTQSDGDLALRFIRIEQLLQAIHYAPFATLALVHGVCWGAGADLVSSCSRRIATPDARFRMPGLRFGVVLGTRRLARLIGREAARDMLETSRTIDAAEAVRIGLLSEIREREKWAEAIEAARSAANALPGLSRRALLEETDDGAPDAEMTALVRSVAAPGLKNRILRYLEDLRAHR